MYKIIRNTTLVLGAGASIPYGFPSGRDLLLEVYDKLLDKNSSFFRLIYDSSVNDIKIIEEFRDSLLKSYQPSIDAFIEKRSEFLDIGKSSIISSLLPYETENKI